MSSAFAGVGALALALPFMILEWANTSDLPRAKFPFPLFLFMWLLAAVFMQTSVGIVRATRAMASGQAGMPSMTALALRVVIAALIAWTWTATLIDQMPCFLGARGC